MGFGLPPVCDPVSGFPGSGGVSAGELASGAAGTTGGGGVTGAVAGGLGATVAGAAGADVVGATGVVVVGAGETSAGDSVPDIY